jgi:NifU-like protein involved in Fe-S cluster formation
MMVAAALREVLLRGEGAGDCTGAGARAGTAEHAVCGDEVRLHVRVQDATIAELRWRAAGCPASMAVAALAAKVLPGVAVATAPARLRDAIAAHGGLAAAERHAEALVLRALAAATRERA